MKKFLMFLCTLTMVFGLVGSASALSYTGSLWHGVAAGWTEADNYLSSVNMTDVIGYGPTDTFTVSAIDAWDRAPAPVLKYSQFLGANGAIISNWDGDNQDTQMSTTSSTAAFFKFEGSGYFTADTIITHDDGAVLFLYNRDGSFYDEYDFSRPSTPVESPLDGLVAGNYDFVLNYSAWNGDPEQIKLTGVGAPVPEPATILLMGLGLFGMVGVRRRMNK